MAPTGETIKTPEGQPTNIESGPPPESPFTDAEIAAQNKESILAGLPGKEEAAKKDQAALEATETEFNKTPPPTEFTEPAGAVIDLQKDKAKLEELQKGQERPGGTAEQEEMQPRSKAPEEPAADQTSAERPPDQRPQEEMAVKSGWGEPDTAARLGGTKSEINQNQQERTTTLLRSKLDQLFDQIKTSGEFPADDSPIIQSILDIFRDYAGDRRNEPATNIEQLRLHFGQAEQTRPSHTKEDFVAVGLSSFDNIIRDLATDKSRASNRE